MSAKNDPGGAEVEIAGNWYCAARWEPVWHARGSYERAPSSFRVLESSSAPLGGLAEPAFTCIDDARPRYAVDRVLLSWALFLTLPAHVDRLRGAFLRMLTRPRSLLEVSPVRPRRV